jgi:hypothetical protein
MKYKKNSEIYSRVKEGERNTTKYKMGISEHELREEVGALLNQLDVEVSFHW